MKLVSLSESFEFWKCSTTFSLEHLWRQDAHLGDKRCLRGTMESFIFLETSGILSSLAGLSAHCRLDVSRLCGLVED